MIAPENYQPIRGVSRSGDFVHRTQEMASEEGFGSVSKPWFEKTKPIEDELQRLASTRNQQEDLTARFGQIEPDFVGNRFCLRVHDRRLFPDRYALGQLGTIVGMGSHYPRTLSQNARDGWAELLAFDFEHAWPEVDHRRRYVLRVQNGDVLRGVLTEGRCLVRNEWYLRLVARAVPGGRLSHWRGDDYTIYGNVLIPDTIRDESDSQYGAMISLSNCEIGKRRLIQQPSLFRAICMNGCIWDQAKGLAFKLTRRGLIDLSMLERELIQNIEEQIPLAKSGLDRLLQTRTFETKTSMKPVFAQVCKESRIPKDLASSVLWAWREESRQTPDHCNTLFAVINGFTRAGQAHDNETWVKFDTIGGRLATLERDDWDDLVSRAARLKAKDVDKTFKRWSLESLHNVSV